MMEFNFRVFMDNLVIENLHPELKDIVTSTQDRVSKQTQIANKIKDLSGRGEETGIEGNMPKGSSRAYLKHKDKTDVTIDGKAAKMETGTKVAIKAKLDNYHKKSEFGGFPLGAIQNHAENGDHWVNQTYRTLAHKGGDDHSFESNHDRGIFPPLLEHDEDSHVWTHVGHSRDIKAGEFRKLTKTKDFPKGISHAEFHTSLTREYNKRNGKYWEQSPEEEKKRDKIASHPLIQKFDDYHGNSGNPPHDYQQQKNLGVWKHPVDGSEHIVARDHGFSTDTQKAYGDAWRNRFLGRKFSR